MKNIKIRVTFAEEALGTSPSNEDIYRDFIASKAPDASTVENEVESIGVAGVVEKGMTVFPKLEDGTPFLYDYQIKGFFKDACGSLSRVGGKDEKGKKQPQNESGKLSAYKKTIDGLIFPQPRQITLCLPNGAVVGKCERHIRINDATGERVALAISESVPAGTCFECNILLLDSGLEKVLREWLDYGVLRGLAQWRNSGKGRFTWEEVKE